MLGILRVKIWGKVRKLSVPDAPAAGAHLVALAVSSSTSIGSSGGSDFPSLSSQGPVKGTRGASQQISRRSRVSAKMDRCSPPVGGRS